MRQSALLAIIILFLYFLPSFSPSTHKSVSPPSDSVQPTNPVKPKMQVVFALDATGSMGELIGTAKDKIWSIVNSLTQVEQIPEIEVGLIFYRDKGDAFITKRIQLTDSIDMVYS